MGGKYSTPDRPMVPENVTRICVARIGGSPHGGRAYKLAVLLSSKPGYETWFYKNMNYKKFLAEILQEIKENCSAEVKEKQSTNDKGSTILEHHSIPFCWLEQTIAGKRSLTPLGGRDMLTAWALETFPDDEAITAVAVTDYKPQWGDLAPSAPKGSNPLGSYADNANPNKV